MVTYSDEAFAGWAVVGNLKKLLEQLAFQCDVSIYIRVSMGLVGRRVSFTVRGTEANVARFRRQVGSITATPVFR